MQTIRRHLVCSRRSGLNFNPGTVTTVDIRLTSSMRYEACSRAEDSELNSCKPTMILLGNFTYYTVPSPNRFQILVDNYKLVTM